MVTDETTSFLNVDLDIYASRPLDDLVHALGKSVTVLYVGRARRRYSAHVALGASGYGHSPDRIILGLVRVVEKLPPEKRALWNDASRRQSKVGIQAQKQPASFELGIHAKTVAAVARVNGDLVITVYDGPERAAQLDAAVDHWTDAKFSS
jgi:hypothetical protein